ncbi:MAG: PAS domain S-box protein [Methanomicrobiales archaeon]
MRAFSPRNAAKREGRWCDARKTRASTTDREQAPEIVGTLLEKRHATFEGFNRRRDGSVFPVEVAAHLFSMDGRPRVLAIARDITERKEMEKRIRDALRQIEANMGQLATLNDQIRNPLTVIVAFADMAPGEVRDPIVARSEEIDRIIQRLD